MTSFRSFLARERLVPVEQLDRALQRQILYGEDLAVNLMEMGVVNEDELAQYLGMFYRLPIVTRSELLAVPPAVAARLPAALAVRHRVSPVAAADEMMVIAAARLLDRTVIDELRQAVGANVSTVVTTPLAVAQALHVHYGAELPPRYQRILERLPRQEAAEPPAPADEAESVPAEAPAPRSRRASGIIVLPGDVPEAEFARVEAENARIETPAAEPPPPPPAPAVVLPPAAPPPAEPPREPSAQDPEPSQADGRMLDGISLSHDSAADRLMEVVLGPPIAPRPSALPPPAEPPPDAAAPERPSLRDTLIMPGPSVVPAAPVEPPAAAAEPPAAVAEPPAAAEEPAPVTPIRSVSVELSEPSPEEEARPALTGPLASLMSKAALPPSAEGAPSTRLTDQIVHLDEVRSPAEALRFTFQAFSGFFRAGILFDLTGASVRVRETFGHSGEGAALRGAELAIETVPATVRNTGQPLLVKVAPGEPLLPLLERLFGGAPRNALFLPITVGPRVVAVLYGDNREEGVTFDAVRDLFHLGWAAGARLAQIIRERRQHQRQIQDVGEDTAPGCPGPPGFRPS